MEVFCDHLVLLLHKLFMLLLLSNAWKLLSIDAATITFARHNTNSIIKLIRLINNTQLYTHFCCIPSLT